MNTDKLYFANDHYFANPENRKAKNFTKRAKGEVEIKYIPEGWEEVKYSNL